MSSAYSTHVGPPGVGEIKLPVAPLRTEQYLQMISAGIFDSSQKVELIGGVITPMAPAGPDHNSSVVELNEIFTKVIDRFKLQSQGTLVLTEGHVFDPDFVLLQRKPEGYSRSLPTAADVKLIVECAASSLKRDRHVKREIYAQAGIQEYWIVDLTEKKLQVFRQPAASGYEFEQTFGLGDSVAPLACPELEVQVAAIFA
jgi:Uma2 family endonuclease